MGGISLPILECELIVIGAVELSEKISKRLKCVAKYIDKGASILDVGTDHAYLPIWLVENGYISHAVASDVCEGPVLSAKRNIEEKGLSGVIEVRMADGLADADIVKPDTVIIAGMGGNLISDILDASEYIKNNACRLVLQPMTKSYDLRKYLSENGFCILTEDLCEDEGRIYQIIVSEYTGKKHALTDTELTLGRENLTDITPLKAKFLKHQHDVAIKRYNGIKAGGEESEYDAQLISDIRRILNDYGEATV